MSTIFHDRAYAESAQILSNVRQNLENCLEARNIKERNFHEWAKQQGIKEFVIARLRRYPPQGFKEHVIQTDHLSVITLLCAYMGISVSTAMSRVMSVEEHREIFRKMSVPNSGTWM
jgi:hypothetical protein